MAVPLRAGDVVVDKYRIERQLGSGGMGVVLQATHLQLNQSVALKFVVESSLEPKIAAERFLREARATFRLRSEHTVRVMDVGTLPSGEAFIVMEMLEGKDFKELVTARGPLPPTEAALYIWQVCSALQEAHTYGIVHRDLKARNLYLTTRVDGSPCVKVLDFGISKVTESSDAAPLTQPDMGMGSPRYMAPEQWTSASTVDARADIYAAGAVFYELLTGQIPLAGMPLVEVIKRIRAGAVPSPKEIRPDLPDALCRVVMKALRPRPEERFATALAFAQAIKQAIPEAFGEVEAKRSKPAMAMTLPTAVMNRDVMLAQARIEAKLAPPPAASSSGSSVAVPSTDPEQPLPSTTLDEGVPIATPALNTRQLEIENDFSEDIATIVTRSPMDDHHAAQQQAQHHATLQVAEAPPEIQAMRAKLNYSGPPPPAQVQLAPPPQPAAPPPPQPTPPLLHMMQAVSQPPEPSQRMHVQQHQPQHDPMMHHRSSAPMPPPVSMPPPLLPPAPPAAAQKSTIPAWLFWTFLVLSFCFAGGVAAALLTHYIQ